ncbi:MAG: hypothetical protein FD155_2502 [Bacteroidetes bacterium]|nr:MAG: hypothetical protein FD155_2502 [Bacteroidota bacterium]
MKKWIFILLLFSLFQSCQTPSKMIQHGNYHAACLKLIDKVNTSSPKEKNLRLLEQAFHTANQQDHDRISLLKASGEPDIWPEVFSLFSRMNERQVGVKALSESTKSAIGFIPMDLNKEIALARSKAKDYLFARANDLLKSNLKTDAREAVDILNELKIISPGYPGWNELMDRAIVQATNRVLVVFVNQSGVNIPFQVEQELMQFSPKELNEQFLQFDLVHQKGVVYDYQVEVVLQKINISPERVDRRRFIEKKEIQDGMQPVRDENGTIVLDSAGKVLEEPRFRMIEAIVNETFLSKDAQLLASVDFYSLPDDRLMQRSPVESGVSFNHRFAIVNGDLRAVSAATTAMMNSGPVPFPPDGNMIMEAAKQLNESLRARLKKEKALFGGEE